MNDTGLSPTAILLIAILYGLAWACCGAAFTIAFQERRDRKAKRSTVHTHTNLVV